MHTPCYGPSAGSYLGISSVGVDLNVAPGHLT